MLFAKHLLMGWVEVPPAPVHAIPLLTTDLSRLEFGISGKQNFLALFFVRAGSLRSEGSVNGSVKLVMASNELRIHGQPVVVLS